MKKLLLLLLLSITMFTSCDTYKSKMQNLLVEKKTLEDSALVYKHKLKDIKMKRELSGYVDTLITSSTAIDEEVDAEIKLGKFESKITKIKYSIDSLEKLN